jgi:hypothetical protein
MNTNNPNLNLQVVKPFDPYLLRNILLLRPVLLSHCLLLQLTHQARIDIDRFMRRETKQPTTNPDTLLTPLWQAGRTGLSGIISTREIERPTINVRNK